MSKNDRLSAEATQRMQGRRVLVVEDQYFLAREMQDELERLGVEVIGPIAAIADALDLIEDGIPIDGAILDLNLRGEMAFPVADSLHGKGIPFVFATGQDPGLVPDRYPGFVLCRKPIKIGEIANALFGDRRLRGAS